MAERELPPADYYGEFAQLDNGVGGCALLKDEFIEALNEKSPCRISRNVTVATGCAAYDLLLELSKLAMAKFEGLTVDVVKVHNEFFGETVTVAGLLTGEDLIKQLENVSSGDALLIPAVSLRNERDKFLDDITIEELSERLGVKAVFVENDGCRLLDEILGGV